MPNNAELAARCGRIEVALKEEVKQGMKRATTITQTNLLNHQIKAYDKNVKIVGMTYDIKDSRTFNKASYDAWCLKVLKTALISTKVLKEEDVFNVVDGETKLIRGIISDLHPLGKLNNSAIVIAFNEASFAHQIRETVRKNQGLNMGKIKILVHLPPILDALHNATLLARKEMFHSTVYFRSTDFILFFFIFFFVGARISLTVKLRDYCVSGSQS